jgi:hypothetical protein
MKTERPMPFELPCVPVLEGLTLIQAESAARIAQARELSLRNLPRTRVPANRFLYTV